MRELHACQEKEKETALNTERPDKRSRETGLEN
jgi:hypothetical protein